MKKIKPALVGVLAGPISLIAAISVRGRIPISKNNNDKAIYIKFHVYMVLKFE